MSCPTLTDSLQGDWQGDFPTVSEVEEAIPYGEEWMLFAYIYSYTSHRATGPD